MSQANIDVVRSAYEAFRRRDVPSVTQLLDPEVEFFQSVQVPWGGLYKGLAEVRQFFEKLTGAVDSTADIDRFLDAGDQILAIGHTRGTARASGKPFEVPIVLRGRPGQKRDLRSRYRTVPC